MRTMRTMRTMLAILSLLLVVPATSLAGEGPANFGGNGAAWQLLYLMGNPYWSKAGQANHTKDWSTATGEVRFTQPGNAEGNADPNSAIQYFPCPGTQVYPKKK